MWVQFLDCKDPLKEDTANHSSTLPWRESHRTEEPGGLQSMGHKESDTTEATEHAGTHTHCVWVGLSV